MRKLLVGVMGAAVLTLVAVPAMRTWAAKLNTSDLAGTWVGTWTNQTFGSTGDINVVITRTNDSEADFQWAITGNVLGCGPVSETHGVLFKGKGRKCGGEACFSDHGVFVKGEDFTFGKVTIKARKNGRFTAKGKNTCGGAGPKKYNGNAKLVGNTLTGKLHIKTSSGRATTTFTATKQ
jgi:hypothetical protein